MPIKFGKRLFTPLQVIEPGELIMFRYPSYPIHRLGIVISPDYKGNMDVYHFDDLMDIPEELLNYIENNILDDGDLWRKFGNEFDYKSFKREEMSGIRSIEFVTYDENIITEKDNAGQDTTSPVDNTRLAIKNISE